MIELGKRLVLRWNEMRVALRSPDRIGKNPLILFIIIPSHLLVYIIASIIRATLTQKEGIVIQSEPFLFSMKIGEIEYI